MPRDSGPSVEPVLLAALSGLVALIIGFATLVYWAAQPTVLPNAGVARFQEEMRQAIARANAERAYESKRTVTAVRDDLDRRGLDQLVREAAQARPTRSVSN
jgi:hypothetical protein